MNELVDLGGGPAGVVEGCGWSEFLLPYFDCSGVEGVLEEYGIAWKVLDILETAQAGWDPNSFAPSEGQAERDCIDLSLYWGADIFG